jgi:hypothetical protein
MAQHCHKDKRPSAYPEESASFGLSIVPGTSKSLSIFDGGSNNRSGDVGLQHVLLADVASCTTVTGVGTSIPHSLPTSSTSPIGLVLTENIVPLSSNMVSNAASPMGAESIALPFSPIPSVSSGIPASIPIFENTTAPYISANKFPRDPISPHGIHLQAPHVGSIPTSRMPLNEEARHVLHAFLHAVGEVLPLDLSDTTFLPTPPNANLSVLPIQSASSPPPAYQHDPSSHSNIHVHSGHSLSAEAPVFVPSSSLSSVPSRVPALNMSWNILQSIPYSLNQPIDRDALKRVKCCRLNLHDCYKLLVQDVGYEDPILDACVRDLLMPYTTTRETIPDFYYCIHAEQVIRIHESVRDGTYQPPNNNQSLNTIPTYPSNLNELRRRASYPGSSDSSESGSSSDTSHISHVSSISSSACNCHKAQVQSVTDEEDDYPCHVSPAEPDISASSVNIPAPAVHNAQLPPVLRPYVPGCQCDWNIHYVDCVAFALFENGLSGIDYANVSIPDKESNCVRVIDWLLS